MNETPMTVVVCMSEVFYNKFHKIVIKPQSGLFLLGAPMTECSALSVRQFIARTILKIDPDQSPTEMICLAWTLRNRAEQMSEVGAMPREIGMVEAEHLCQMLLSDMGIAKSCSHAQGNGVTVNGGAAVDAAALDRALACVSMVWDGVVSDPTNGATRVHPHDEQPAWAEHCQATALIGPMLFFRADSVEMDT